MESIEKMESDFKNCHMFLVTVLNKAVCRGSFPHCKYMGLFTYLHLHKFARNVFMFYSVLMFVGRF